MNPHFYYCLMITGAVCMALPNSSKANEFLTLLEAPEEQNEILLESLEDNSNGTRGVRSISDIIKYLFGGHPPPPEHVLIQRSRHPYSSEETHNTPTTPNNPHHNTTPGKKWKSKKEKHQERIKNKEKIKKEKPSKSKLTSGHPDCSKSNSKFDCHTDSTEFPKLDSHPSTQEPQEQIITKKFTTHFESDSPLKTDLSPIQPTAVRVQFVTSRPFGTPKPIQAAERRQFLIPFAPQTIMSPQQQQINPTIASSMSRRPSHSTSHVPQNAQQRQFNSWSYPSSLQLVDESNLNFPLPKLPPTNPPIIPYSSIPSSPSPPQIFPPKKVKPTKPPQTDDDIFHSIIQNHEYLLPGPWNQGPETPEPSSTYIYDTPPPPSSETVGKIQIQNSRHPKLYDHTDMNVMQQILISPLPNFVQPQKLSPQFAQPLQIGHHEGGATKFLQNPNSIPNNVQPIKYAFNYGRFQEPSFSVTPSYDLTPAVSTGQYRSPQPVQTPVVLSPNEPTRVNFHSTLRNYPVQNSPTYSTVTAIPLRAQQQQPKQQQLQRLPKELTTKGYSGWTDFTMPSQTPLVQSYTSYDYSGVGHSHGVKTGSKHDSGHSTVGMGGPVGEFSFNYDPRIVAKPSMSFPESSDILKNIDFAKLLGGGGGQGEGGIEIFPSDMATGDYDDKFDGYSVHSVFSY